MHVVSPERYRIKSKKRSYWPFVVMPIVVLLVGGTINFARPLPKPTAQFTITVPAAATTTALDWPAQGQAAIAASGYGLLATNGAQSPLATASITKVILALCVLDKLPLSTGQSGPFFVVGTNDVALYRKYVAMDGSNLAVSVGDNLSEYQALQAIMIPSSNNIADSLVQWVFGSQEAYKSYATKFLKTHNLTNTFIGTDASGFDASTKSSASDLASLGLVALKNPVLMEIAGQTSATFDTAGTVYNYNRLLGEEGITGLKTGNNNENPGAFLFTSTVRLDTTDLLLTGAVMGDPDLPTALNDSLQLSTSIGQNFEQVTVASAGKQVGSYRTVWGQSVPILLSQDLQLIRWKTTPITESHTVDLSKRSGVIGTIKIASGQVESQSELTLGRAVNNPSFWWRLTRH